MGMNELYELAREANRLLGFVAWCWLIYRTVRAWPAEWAKPDHVEHYRVMLLVTSGFTLACSLAAYQYERSGAPAGPVSVLYTILCAAVLLFCWLWPKPAAWRDPRAAVD